MLLTLARLQSQARTRRGDKGEVFDGNDDHGDDDDDLDDFDDHVLSQIGSLIIVGGSVDC